MTPHYDKGLAEVGDGVWAYLQPDGGWGWSNAGLVVGDDGALLVDTLFDLRLTGEMLAEMGRLLPGSAGISTVVNTHANGDHCFGNALVGRAEIVASRAAAAEMAALPPARMAELMRAAPEMGRLGAFLQRIFGPFDFEGIEQVLPSRTFDGQLELTVGGRRVRLIEVGPAHTAGDVVAHLPEDGVLFTGDMLFHGGHPIVWAGPVANWIAACDRLLSLEVATVVPGHGPLASPVAIAAERDYFVYLRDQARPRFDAGMTLDEAVRDLELGPYADWSEPERVAVNVRALYRDFGAEVPGDAASLLGAMAELAAGR